MTDDLLERLRALPGATPLFDALADVPGVWVVGGAVRDTLLGRDPRDLDLVVEGDAARRPARLLGEEPLVHERFGTATPATGEVNLAAARRERYERPGALPEVELGALDRPRTWRGATSASTRSPCGSPTARSRRTRARSRTSRSGGCACCTSARSSTTPRACCA